jgi:hypothetical protein
MRRTRICGQSANLFYVGHTICTHETPTGASASWALELDGGDDGTLKVKPETVATWAMNQAVPRNEAILEIQLAIEVLLKEAW